MKDLSTNKEIDGTLSIKTNDQKSKECSSCGEIFSNVRNLIIHIHTVHEGHKHHKCEFCGKSFSGAQYLKKHIHIVHGSHQDHKM